MAELNKTSQPASADQGHTSDRPLVNYIWINPHPKAAVNVENPVCAIEMGNIQLALDNANKYPDADFQIWVDKKLLDDYSLFCLDCFMREKTQQDNVTLCDLQDIPDYANDPYFEPLTPQDKGYLYRHFNSRTGTRNIYSRADLSRILVLEHCMESHPEQHRIIYSDIDCPDIRLPEALPKMDQYGVAIYDLGSLVVSHGYIGIAADNTSVREQFKTLKSETKRHTHNNYMGFTAFENFLKALDMPNDTWHNKIGLSGLLPPTRTNPPPLPYTPPPEKLEAWKSTHQSQARNAPMRSN